MCGITGVWNYNCVDSSGTELDAFLLSLAHRGPDNSRYWRDTQARLSLGHTRLAILDLSSTGDQPMSSDDGRYTIVYNGEVYNFVELRKELESQGHSFRSNTDTEVVLRAFVAWGEDCQFRFNGMWAFAIWDAQERELFLSRDRFGIKPLHYVFSDRFFAFASEMKSFLALREYDFGIDWCVAEQAIRNIDGLEGTEHCLLTGVKRLVGGHCLTLGVGKPPRIRRWWVTAEYVERSSLGFADQVENYRDLFVDACRIRMRSDVPIGTSLSGGLDSSSVFAAIHRTGQSGRFTDDWHRAFVACFPDTHLDETEYARRVIEDKAAEAVYTEVKIEDLAEHVVDIIYQMEDVNHVLLAGLWANYRSMRREGVIVSLDGHGADELLGGYHFIVREEMQNALAPFPRLLHYVDLRRTLMGYIGGSNEIVPSVVRDYCLGLVRKQRNGLLGKAYRLARYGNVKSRVSQEEAMLNRQSALVDREEIAGLSHLGRNLYTYFHDTVLPTILRNFDRASMAHGVEVRMPFMDWRLVTLSFSLPDRSKIGGGYPKRILREAMQGMLNDQIRLRTNKVGFTSPMRKWLSGPLRQLFMDTISGADFSRCVAWNGARVSKAVEGSMEKDIGRTMEEAWPIVNMHILAGQFRERRSTYMAMK
ncbi:MAG: asparagine synthase (glutamine-hydrolyzing) [Chloroflexi bacterium]|nr:asparagine synthase (glutamine-hydrolyzing) [Chloroflexota bacterium]